MERLFVYGTLAPGRPNAHILGDVSGTWTPASVKGSLHEQGWGAEMGYPGLRLDYYDDNDENVDPPTDNLVKGFLFSSNELPGLWTKLDEFEGTEYKRVQTKVLLEDGSIVTAFVYCLDPED